MKDKQSNDFLEKNIRRYFDDIEKDWYFSITDVIGLFIETSDSRNYWKVLKNRLKKGNNELVTNCNQLKMPSSDGKFYLTDVANERTILEILKIISPENLGKFSRFVDEINKKELENHANQNNLSTSNFELKEDPTEKELPIELIEVEDYFMINAFISGVELQNLSILVGYKTVTVKGKKENKSTANLEYFIQELFWGKFYRKIELPSLIDINEVEANIKNGILNIKLKKINELKIVNIKPHLS